MQNHIAKMDNQELEMEIGFAKSALDENHSETVAWLKALQEEADKRKIN